MLVSSIFSLPRFICGYCRFFTWVRLKLTRFPLFCCGYTTWIGHVVNNGKKVGTGFHGTLSGNVYRSRKTVLDEIRAYKGMEVVREEDDEDDENGDEDDDDEDDGPREEVRKGRLGTCSGMLQTKFVPQDSSARRRASRVLLLGACYLKHACAEGL